MEKILKRKDKTGLFTASLKKRLLTMSRGKVSEELPCGSCGNEIVHKQIYYLVQKFDGFRNRSVSRVCNEECFKKLDLTKQIYSKQLE